MSETRATLLQRASNAIKAENKQEAREALHQLVKNYPDDFTGWLWLSGLENSPKISLACLAKAEALRPHDPRIKKARSWAIKRFRKESSSTPPPATSLQKPVIAPVAATVASPTPSRPTVQSAQLDTSTSSRWRKPLLFAGGLIALFACLLAVAWFGWGNSNPSTDKVEAANNEPIAQIAEESNTTSVVSEDTLNGAEQSTQSDLLLSQTTSENLADMVENPEVSVAENIIPQENVADVAEFVIDMDAAADSVAATIQEVTGSSDNSEPDNVLVVIESKSIANNGQTNEPRAQWTPTPLPTATPLPTSTPLPPTSTPEPIVVSTSDIPVSVGANERWVDVNLTTQILTAYVGREAVFSTYISSGLPQYATVTGQFRIYLEYESQNMSGAPYGYDYYIEGVPYVMYFHKGFALHGAYWHTNFGTPQSHGCVNLSVSDAAYMWDFADIGTLVNVHY